MTSRNRRAGFTLLEVLVATVVMGIAVAGLIAGLSQSVRNAGRLSDYDRSAMLARAKMNELILDPSLPYAASTEGNFGTGPGAMTGGLQSQSQRQTQGKTTSGWKAVTRPFESRNEARPGEMILEEIALEVWWQPAVGTRRTLQLAGYRQRIVPLPSGEGLNP